MFTNKIMTHFLMKFTLHIQIFVFQENFNVCTIILKVISELMFVINLNYGCI